MNFKRDHLKDHKVLYFLLSLLGIVIISIGILQLKWYWNFISFPLGLIISFYFFKNFKNQNRIISNIEFSNEKTIIKFINSPQKEIPLEKLAYSILVQKFHKPIRAIEFREKRKIGLFKSKSIGTIEIAHWKNIKNIADFMIQKDFKREEWSFGWNWGNILMIFAILLGSAETGAAEYVGDFKIDHTLSDTLMETGDLISTNKNNKINKSEKTKNKFLSKKKKP